MLVVLLCCCCDLWDGGGGGVTVRVRWEGKSDSVGGFLLGIFFFFLYACRMSSGVVCKCELPLISSVLRNMSSTGTSSTVDEVMRSSKLSFRIAVA